jgi:hypothetical protein
MGWPKGVPRKGYVKKDGTTHAMRGSGVRRLPKDKPFRAVTVTLARPTKVVAPSSAYASGSASPYVPHGDRPGRSVVQPCPNCLYAYADGGYCPECGWSMPLTNVHKYGTVTGRKWK